MEGEKADMTATTGVLIGYTHYLDREFTKAISYYNRYTPVLEVIQGEFHPSVQKFKARIHEMETSHEGVS
jgi:hypothetical protein